MKTTAELTADFLAALDRLPKGLSRREPLPTRETSLAIAREANTVPWGRCKACAGLPLECNCPEDGE